MSKKLEAYFGLPKKIKFCKECSISNQRPNSAVEMKNKNKNKKTIAFNEVGVCSACSFNSDKKDIDWKEREEKLFELLEPYRSLDGSYDVLVPSSGGKDSAFAAHMLKYKYKMNPLAITWAPNMFTNACLRRFIIKDYFGTLSLLQRRLCTSLLQKKKICSRDI